MKKEAYEAPVTEITVFHSEDVIVTSSIDPVEPETPIL
jgi:hypothetical protein